MKKKTKFPVSSNIDASLFVKVYSMHSPQIISAVCKGATLEEAKNVSRELWKISKEPYLAHIVDDEGMDIFTFKG